MLKTLTEHTDRVIVIKNMNSNFSSSINRSVFVSKSMLAKLKSQKKTSLVRNHLADIMRGEVGVIIPKKFQTHLPPANISTIIAATMSLGEMKIEQRNVIPLCMDATRGV